MTMAIFLRRAFSSKNVCLLRSSALYGHRDHSQQLFSSGNGPCSSDTHKTLSPPNFDFLGDSRRCFAKGRKSKEDCGSSTVAELPDMGPIINLKATSQMDSAIAALSPELSKLRTGRASSGMLDDIMVDPGDVKLPLNQIAVISVMDSKTLSVNPFDPSGRKSMEKAIIESPLGLNPKVDGERLIAAIPPLTKEHFQAMDTIKKMQPNYPKDDIKRLEKEVEGLTKKFIKTAEDLCKAKEEEIKS